MRLRGHLLVCDRAIKVSQSNSSLTAVDAPSSCDSQLEKVTMLHPQHPVWEVVKSDVVAPVQVLFMVRIPLNREVCL